MFSVKSLFILVQKNIIYMTENSDQSKPSGMRNVLFGFLWDSNGLASAVVQCHTYFDCDVQYDWFFKKISSKTNFMMKADIKMKFSSEIYEISLTQNRSNVENRFTILEQNQFKS